MSVAPLKVLVVGATGSVGRLVVDEAIRQGHAVRVLVRDLGRATRLAAQALRIVGDLTGPDTLVAAVDSVDAIVFTHGADGGGKAGAEHISYGGVRNMLSSLGGRPARIALMTAIGVTNRNGAYNRSTEAHDWKRRSERLLRASGLSYTIVRPGWFDCNTADQHTDWFCFKATLAMRGTPVTVWWRVRRSPRCWCTASRPPAPRARPSSWWQSASPPPRISMRSLYRWTPTSQGNLMRCATRRTCPWRRSLSACVRTCGV